jgi:hypothetical protein
MIFLNMKGIDTIELAMANFLEITGAKFVIKSLGARTAMAWAKSLFQFSPAKFSNPLFSFSGMNGFSHILLNQFR